MCTSTPIIANIRVVPPVEESRSYHHEKSRESVFMFMQSSSLYSVSLWNRKCRWVPRVKRWSLLLDRTIPIGAPHCTRKYSCLRIWPSHRALCRLYKCSECRHQRIAGPCSLQRLLLGSAKVVLPLDDEKHGRANQSYAEESIPE